MMISVSEEQNKEVPDGLALIQALVNTQYGTGKRHSHVELTRPDHLRVWLVQHHLVTDEMPITEGDLRRILQLREALRDLLRANNENEQRTLQVDLLNHLASNAPLIVQFDAHGAAILQADVTGVDGVIAHLMSIVFTGMIDGSWGRLKSCRNERCQKAFYDSSKNRSGTWCSMATCGSRFKASMYRQRKEALKEG